MKEVFVFFYRTSLETSIRISTFYFVGVEVYFKISIHNTQKDYNINLAKMV